MLRQVGVRLLCETEKRKQNNRDGGFQVHRHPCGMAVFRVHCEMECGGIFMTKSAKGLLTHLVAAVLVFS